MSKRLTLALVGIVLLSLLGVTAVNAVSKDDPHNLVVTAGGGNSLLQVVQKVLLYGVDPKTGKRTEDPVLTVSSVLDPLYLLAPEGKYDIIVYVPWVSRGLLLGQVVVKKNEVAVFDTREIELPDELVIR